VRAPAVSSAVLWIAAFAMLGVVALVPDLPATLEAMGRMQGSLDPACTPDTRPCPLRWPDGLQMMVSLDPPGMPINTPITVRLDGPGGALTGGMAVWSGHDMSMGRTALPLREAGPGAWVAQGPLPACVRGAMTWRLDLLLESKAGPRAAHALLPTGPAGG
jgi:hypothetical protein